MNEAALNGEHGAEAQSNEILAEVQRRITAAMAQVPLKSADAGTLVVPGWPLQMRRSPARWHA